MSGSGRDPTTARRRECPRPRRLISAARDPSAAYRSSRRGGRSSGSMGVGDRGCQAVRIAAENFGSTRGRRAALGPNVTGAMLRSSNSSPLRRCECTPGWLAPRRSGRSGCVSARGLVRSLCRGDQGEAGTDASSSENSIKVLELRDNLASAPGPPPSSPAGTTSVTCPH